MEDDAMQAWAYQCEIEEMEYQELLKQGNKPKTELEKDYESRTNHAK